MFLCRRCGATGCVYKRYISSTSHLQVGVNSLIVHFTFSNYVATVICRSHFAREDFDVILAWDQV